MSRIWKKIVNLSLFLSLVGRRQGRGLNDKSSTTSILRNLISPSLLLIILSPGLHSQQVDLPFEYFSVDEGMPTTVRYIYQDKTGFLWFATNSGLYKYDGYSFTSYKNDINDSTSLIENTVTALYEDKEGTLWVGTRLGLEKLNHATNTFTHYTPDSSLLEESGSDIRAICEDKYGTLWVGNGNGLYKFDKTTGKFTYIKYDRTFANNSLIGVNAIYEDKDKSLWVGTNVGLDKLHLKTGKFIHYWNNPSNDFSLYSIYWVNSIFRDEAGLIWLGTNNGLVEFNPTDSAFYIYRFNVKTIENLKVTSICQDVVSGDLWLATWSGLCSFDRKSKRFTSYKKHDGNCVLSERSGTLWIGTNADIRKLNRIGLPFKKYPMNQVVCAVRSFGKQDAVWVWTFSGYKKFDLNREQFIPYPFGKGNKPYFVYSENEMLVQTEKGGFYVTDTLGNTKQISPDSLKDFNNSLTWTCKTKKGYWFGAANGGFYFTDPTTSQFIEIRNLKLKINFIYEDRTGLLWISTLMGKLFCYDPERDSLAEFMSDDRNPSSISGRHVTQIYEDTKGRLWFTTTNGLNRYDRSTNEFTRFTEKNGLAGNNTWGMLEDDHGYLWIITTKGISKFDPKTNHFKNYDVSYGVDPVTDVYFARGHKARNGEMYFPGAHGFTRFHPDSIKDNAFIPPIVIISFKVFDKRHAFFKEIHLPYGENSVSF